jgi:hypothetical protein
MRAGLVDGPPCGRAGRRQRRHCPTLVQVVATSATGTLEGPSERRTGCAFKLSSTGRMLRVSTKSMDPVLL